MARGEKMLGTLCRRGHDYNGTGKSLRYRGNRKGNNGPCAECIRLTAAKYYYINQDIIKQNRRRNAKQKQLYNKIYRERNIERIKAHDAIYSKKYRENNKDKSIEYRKRNKAKLKDYEKQYRITQMENNTTYHTRLKLRGLVYQAMKRYSRNGKTELCRDMGIDIKGIIEHLGPHPNILGVKGNFNIDHIIPLAAFNLDDPEQIKVAFGPSNHRWLSANENRSKSKKILPPEEIPLELVALLKNHNMRIPTHG